MRRPHQKFFEPPIAKRDIATLGSDTLSHPPTGGLRERRRNTSSRTPTTRQASHPRSGDPPMSLRRNATRLTAILAILGATTAIVCVGNAAGQDKPTATKSATGTQLSKMARVPTNLGFVTSVSDDGQAATLIFDNLLVDVEPVRKGSAGPLGQTDAQTKVVTLEVPYTTDQRSVSMAMDLRGFLSADAGRGSDWSPSRGTRRRSSISPRKRTSRSSLRGNPSRPARSVTRGRRVTSPIASSSTCRLTPPGQSARSRCSCSPNMIATHRIPAVPCSPWIPWTSRSPVPARRPTGAETHRVPRRWSILAASKTRGPTAWAAHRRPVTSRGDADVLDSDSHG